MIYYDSLHCSLPFYRYATYFTALWGWREMIWDQFLTIFVRNDHRFTLNHISVLSWALASNQASGAWPRGSVKPWKGTKWTTPICLLVPFPQVKQMFNQGSYRFQKSQCDKCGWKQPANRAMSDWMRPRCRKHRKYGGRNEGRLLLLFFFFCFLVNLMEMWAEKEEFPMFVPEVLPLSLCCCIINYSTEAGRAKDKLILFTVVDQFIHPKIYICK